MSTNVTALAQDIPLLLLIQNAIQNNEMSYTSKCRCCEFLTANLFCPETTTGNGIDTRNNTFIDEGDDVLSPKEAWNLLTQQNQEENCLLLVDTHGHPHLNGESTDLYAVQVESNDNVIVTLTCAVEQLDWEICLEYVSQSQYRMGAIGIHPWYLADLKSTWLEDLESLIIQHPGCMVGEIGLCKMARFVRTYEHGKQAALELQRSVFISQLKLAAKYQRPVSIHCVDQHGVMLDILKGLDLSELPPVMALHSFSGTAHQVQQLLRWEDDLFGRRKNGRKKNNRDVIVSLPSPSYEQPLIYFGFSHTINYAMCSSDKSRRQGREAIRCVPSNRLLAESDVHTHHDVFGATAGAVGYISWALNMTVLDVATLTRDNGLRYLQRLSEISTNSVIT